MQVDYKHFKILLLVLSIVSVFLLVLSFLVGSSGVSLQEFGQILSGEASQAIRNIFFEIRLPRAIGAFFIGAALSMAGGGLQSVFKNPMADPFVLGISSGAALGATLGMTLFAGRSIGSVGAITLLSFVFALGTIFLVYNISKIQGKVSTFSLLLSGFSVSALFSALIHLIMLINRDKMENVILWNMGSLTSISWAKLGIILPIIIICSIALMFYAKPLNILLHGDEVSQSLGVDTHKTRRNLLILTSLLAAAAVSVSGIIGFVGLMVPHLLRLMIGPDNRKLLPLCFVGGGAYLLACDLIARTALTGQEVPVGVVTAIFGVPFFILLLRKGRKVGL